ncbi:serine hydrolase [Amycolatopsis sp. Hca4]|uniref:serine hydrolase domain-containing protein n=1 Tax=Amycolatopsis sp. Hca4 TaxID=2742131 RepID=UPI0015922F93|nr:serine hydrolase domain-containing protein [Amycolatopsis sp. Hca4]QKV73398.1 beta-lactamase family protein [Amycolatopsis sp. Hca4]
MRKLVAALTVAGLLGGTATVAEAKPSGKAALQEQLDALVGQFPAALASVSRGGRTESLVAGSARLGSRVPVPVDGRVRAGSNTKTFTAVVVLQLVAEGKVALDAPIERYLPGLVPGGSAITVRQLLQHTSGLPNYTEYLGLEDVAKLRHRYFEPHELLAVAFAHPAKFAPGTKWEYSNTNYVLAGLLVQRVTGRPVAEEITSRVIRKAGLRNTYWPAAGDEGIRGPHPQGYARSGGEVVDVTELDPSWGWAAGQLISTPGDLARFSRALLDGRLLPAAQLAEMRKTVDAPLAPGWRYGLGLFRVPLSCGGEFWGHGGDIHGFETRGGATDDGRAVGLAVTALPGTFGDGDQGAQAVLSAVDAAFCR